MGVVGDGSYRSEKGLYEMPLMTSGLLYGMKIAGGGDGNAVLACGNRLEEMILNEGKLSWQQ